MRHSLTLDYRHLPDRGGYLVRALLELQGDPVENAARVPLHLSLVLDRSGSMHGEPLDCATRAAADLVRRLAPEDVVSVVAFDDEIITVVPPHSSGGEEQVTERILAIAPGGSTNLSGGWLRGRQWVSRGRTDGALHRVLLLTDGHANAGITDRLELAALAAEARAKGISTSCIGFGESYDEELLKAMSDAGGGNLFHIERADQAALAFSDELAGLQTLSGQNVQVAITLDPAVTIAQVHHDWPHTDAGDSRTFELGDLYAREPKRLLVELFCISVPDALQVRALARLRVSADVRESDGGMAHVTVELPVATTLEGAGQEAPVITREVLLSQAAQARTEAAEMVRRGEGRDASRKLRAVRRAMESSSEPSLYVQEITDLEQLAGKFEEDGGDEADARYMRQKAHNSRRGKAGYDAVFSRPRPRSAPADPATGEID